MLIFFVTFIVTTTIWAAGLWFVIARVTRHLKGNPAGTAAVCEHVLVPLFGKSEPAVKEEKVSESGEILPN